jgi:hypothetical protein
LLGLFDPEDGGDMFLPNICGLHAVIFITTAVRTSNPALSVVIYTTGCNVNQ